jgi:hypothetical protein
MGKDTEGDRLDGIGVLVRCNWLKSKAASILFFCSAVALSCLWAVALPIAIPGVRQFLNSSPALSFFAYLFIALCVVAIPSTLILFFGMAVFCACTSQASIGVKVQWFVLFFLSGPIGSTVYYFTVYRGYIRRKAMVGADFAHSSSEAG